MDIEEKLPGVFSPLARREKRLRRCAIVLLAGTIVLADGCKKTPAPTSPDQSVDTTQISLTVENLLQRMTVDEKIGQMVQAERSSLTETDIRDYFLGSVLSGGGSSPGSAVQDWQDMVDRFQSYALQTRLRIPILYGADAVHGHNNMRGATIFPHNIGLGCTRDSTLVRRIAEATAEEVAGTGVHWTFSPCIAVARDERWGRTYESFGETAELAMQFAPAEVQGYQTHILACAKHYLGDGGTQNGINEGNMVLDEASLRAIHLPGYRAAVDAGVATVMASFSSWNGVRMHANKYLLTDVLKTELGFKGFVVSDWDGVLKLSSDYAAGLETAINAGIDMVMAPADYRVTISTLKTLVAQHRIPMTRIDDAVRRILGQKFRFGLFDHPMTNRSLGSSVGTAAHRALAREAVRKSLVLLKNANNVLPLGRQIAHIHVVGKAADDIGMQCGGWTITWQGGYGNTTPGTSILQAIRNTVSPTTLVTYSPTGMTNGTGADCVVVVLGEPPYAETYGDRTSLSLDNASGAMVQTVANTGVPLVVILLSGRPLPINDVLANSNAFIAAWLPGTEGDGVADVLFGDAAPSGKLSHTWPNDASQIPVNVGDAGASQALFPFGFGLTY